MTSVDKTLPERHLGAAAVSGIASLPGDAASVDAALSRPQAAAVEKTVPDAATLATPAAVPAHPRVMSLPALLTWLAPLRAAGKVIVFTNGCYDILHPGHVDLLSRARALGDVLVLGLNSDASVRRQNKGPERPVNPFGARAFVLAHLASVDAVVEFDEDTPARLIAAIVPDVLVKGGDWALDRIVGRDTVEAHGGRIVSLPLLPGYSTTAIVRKLRA